MNEGLKKFEELVKTDESLQGKLQEALQAYTGEQTEEAIFSNVLAPVAAEYGISATFEEFKEYIDSIRSPELSPDELKQVAGGSFKDDGPPDKSSCRAIGMGMGDGDGNCIIIGQGEL